MKTLRKVVGLSSLAILVIVGVSCSSGGSEKTSDTTAVVDSTVTPDTEVASDTSLLAGSASASVLPTVDGSTDYLADAPGWNESAVDPIDIGVYVPMFDQGSVDVGNGSSDASWVHDDIRATALALDRQGERGRDVEPVRSAEFHRAACQSSTRWPWRRANITREASNCVNVNGCRCDF